MKTSNTTHTDPDTSVPVIASFNKAGEIRPLYVRMNGIALRVLSFWVKSTYLNTLEFQCKVYDAGVVKPLRLIYYQSEGIWIVPSTI